MIGQTPESNSDGVFVVDKETGMIKLDKALDRERTSAYHFKVMAMLQQGRLDAVSAVDVEVKVQVSMITNQRLSQIATKHQSPGVFPSWN